jgi:DNA-directed RNA polymerase I, II, and III subunit RPABC2
MSDNEYSSESETENFKKTASKKIAADSDEESEYASETDASEPVEESSDESDMEDVNEENLYDSDDNAKPAAAKKKAAVIAPDDEEFMFNSDYASDTEDDDEDDVDGSEYLKKIKDNMKHDVISEYHPELVQHNYEEVEALCTIVRDQQGRIIDPLHKTLPFLTKYEKARILGERAKQISGGAKPFVDLGPEIIDGFLIAQAELEQKKIPFIVRRPLQNGGCEYWRLKDLEFI